MTKIALRPQVRRNCAETSVYGERFCCAGASFGNGARQRRTSLPLLEKKMIKSWFLNRLLYVMVGLCLLGWGADANCGETALRKKVLILNSYHSVNRL